MNHFLRLGVGLVFSLSVLTGCATQTATSSTSKPADLFPRQEPLPIRETPNMIANLLIAESAARHDALELTLAYYSRVGHKTNDPEVLEQAARLAAYLHKPQQALELAELWLRQEPNSRRAREIAALAAVSLGKSELAARHINRLMASNPRGALSSLVGRARQLDSGANESLLAALSSLVDEYPKQAALWYARALYRQHQGRFDAAIHAVEQALQYNPDHKQALLLKGRLLARAGRTEQATEYYGNLVERFPDSARIRTRYARQLIDNNQLEQAREQIRILRDRFPMLPELRVSLAIHALHQQAYDLARDTLTYLLHKRYRQDDMRLYLARVARESGHPNKAIHYFLAVSGGEVRLHAHVQAARLLYQQGRSDRAVQVMQQLRHQYPAHAPSLYAAQARMLQRVGKAKQALALLNSAIDRPGTVYELLYARAMVAEKLGMADQAIADLRRVLELRPDSAVALNALGYTLADHGRHLEQARAYIERALKMQPENPAFLDSMGWVLYRQGHLEKAAHWLQRAWQKMHDPEVAAHYGEVLWKLGKKHQARQVWQTALDQADNAQVVVKTMKRLTGEAS